jgi:MoaA/NifB/PqqE/SkfB family radical SAM enzyme
VLLSPQEKEDIKRFHIRSNKRNTGPVVAANAYLESAEMFGCNAGYHHCFIDASGEVCPCDLMPLSFGNLTEHSFHEVWNAMEPFFPRPQANCLMGRLAGKIPVTTLPLPPAQSSNLLSDIEPSALPRLYQHLLPRQRSK